jgi:hypothetical protein
MGNELSEIQEVLLGGLQLLPMEKDNIIMVMLMLKSSEQQQMAMCQWLEEKFKKEVMPTQEEVMDMAQYIMRNIK